MRQELKTGLWILAGICSIFVIGTIGYVLIEGWGLLDSLYMTVTTIFTVGFGEVHPLSRAGTVFTLLLIISGVGMILYGIGAMMEWVVGGQLSGVFRRRVVRRNVDRLNEHYVICGYGRVGESVARQFSAHKVKFVVVDNDPDSLAAAERDSFLTVKGDAATDEVLEAAGVARAKGLVAAVGSDAGNIFVVLSARVLNPGLLIVARAGTEDAISKLRRAGADQVVSPYGIGGKRMATLMLKPLVSDYLEVVTGGGELAFLVEEFQLAGDCCVIGQSIETLDIRKKTGATILAVQRASTGVFDTNPSPDTRLNPGDKLIAIGTPEEISGLEKMIGAPMEPRESTATNREAPAGL
ncbi:MAG: potassium channel protein [Thermoleophilia bacterium]|nr:potassium channel protein [Thermoleophilia bacterium]